MFGDLIIYWLCYTLCMQHAYWFKWDSFLSRWGLKSLTCILLDTARPLLPLFAQVMVLGSPLMKGISTAAGYEALVDLLDDEASVSQFADFIKERQG